MCGKNLATKIFWAYFYFTMEKDIFTAMEYIIADSRGYEQPSSYKRPHVPQIKLL